MDGLSLLLLHIVAIVLVWSWGIYLGWKSREHYAERKLQQWMSEVIEDEKEEIQKHVLISLEKHDGVLYCYDKKTNKFMAQADSKEDLEKRLSELFPGKKFAATAENLREVGFHQ